jgi:hypothetical protein
MFIGGVVPNLFMTTDTDFLELIFLRENLKETSKVTNCNHFLKWLQVIQFVQNSAHGTKMAAEFSVLSQQHLAQSESRCRVLRKLRQANSTAQQIESKTTLFEALPTVNEIQTLTNTFMKINFENENNVDASNFIR